MSRETLGRYQMLWDCPACGTTGLLGLDHRYCPACGSPQDPTRRYYPDETQKILVEDHPFHGADRVCPACSTPNAAAAKHCTSCGSPLDDAAAAAVRAEKLVGAADSAKDATAEGDARKAAEREAREAEVAARSGAALPAKGGGGAGKWIFGCVATVLVGIALLVCGGLVFEQCGARGATAVVAGHAWTRTIEVEERRAVSETAWRDGLPSGARDVSCSREQRSTKKIQDGQTCVDKRVDHGDGTFSEVRDCSPKYREEPVYDDRCRYTVDRWVVSDTKRASGSSLSPAPSWPSAPAATATRREGARKETYEVRLRLPDGDEASCAVPQARWSGLADGASVAVKVGGLTGKVDCDSVAGP